MQAYAFTSAPYGYTAYVAATLDTPSASLYGDFLQDGWAEVDFLVDVADYGFGDYMLQTDHSAYSQGYNDPSWYYDPSWWYSQDPSCYQLISSGGASATCPAYFSGGNFWLGKSNDSVTARGPSCYCNAKDPAPNFLGICTYSCICEARAVDSTYFSLRALHTGCCRWNKATCPSVIEGYANFRLYGDATMSINPVSCYDIQ